jgi:hypothetical protein
MVAGNAEVGGLGRRKKRARLFLRYHECASPREPARELNQINCIERTLIVIRRSGRHKCGSPGDIQVFVLILIVKAVSQCPINLNFSDENLLSNFTNQKISRKSIGMDVAFEKALLETKRSKLARVFALPG